MTILTDVVRIVSGVAPPHESVVTQVTNHLRHQIACFERVLEGLSEAVVCLNDPQAAWVDHLPTDGEDELALLERQSGPLAKAWQAAEGVSEEDREVVRQLAQRADGLSKELGALHEQINTALEAKTGDVQSSLFKLRRGTAQARRYLAGGDICASFIDKRA